MNYAHLICIFTCVRTVFTLIIFSFVFLLMNWREIHTHYYTIWNSEQCIEPWMLIFTLKRFTCVGLSDVWQWICCLGWTGGVCIPVWFCVSINHLLRNSPEMLICFIIIKISSFTFTLWPLIRVQAQSWQWSWLWAAVWIERSWTRKRLCAWGCGFVSLWTGFFMFFGVDFLLLGCYG